MAIGFGERQANGTYPVIPVKESVYLKRSVDTNLKGDHTNDVPVIKPEQQINGRFKAKQIPQTEVRIK